MVKIIQNYAVHEQIGQGEYGKVYRGVDSKTKKEVAVKVIHTSKFKQNPKLEQCTLNQIEVLSKIDSPNIVRFIEILKTANNFYFFYEYCNQGTLEQKIKKSGHLSQPLVLSYLSQILQAFKILSSRNIMHRDLKPGNILLHQGKIKLADFGFCKSLQNNKDLAQTMLGSPIYMAPEVLKGQIYTIKADVWSLGVVLYECLYGFCPYEESSIAKLINLLDESALTFNRQINDISAGLEQLIRRMLTKDHFKRITWEQIFQYKIILEGAYYKIYMHNNHGNTQFRQNKSHSNQNEFKQSFDKQPNTITSFSVDKRPPTTTQNNLFKKKINKQNELEASDSLKRMHHKIVQKVRTICQVVNFNYFPDLTIPLAHKLLQYIQRQVAKFQANKIFTKQISQLEETLKIFGQTNTTNLHIPLLSQYVGYVQKVFPNAFATNLQHNRQVLIHLLQLLEFNDIVSSRPKQLKLVLNKQSLLDEINVKMKNNSI